MTDKSAASATSAVPSAPSAPSTIQDAFVSAIVSSLNSSKGDNLSFQTSFNDNETSPSFSLHILTHNFRKFSSRVGIIFQIRDTLTSIFQWETPSKTLSFMCIYTIICINPSLILMIPTMVLIFGFLLPSYELRYPSDSNTFLNKNLLVLKKSQANGKQSEGRDFATDIKNIQNSMSDYTRLYDSISNFLIKYTSFHDEKLSSTLFLSCVIISFFLMLFSHWISMRLVFLLLGWILILSRNSDVQKAVKVLIEEYKKNQLEINSNFFLNYDFIYNWINYNYIPPEVSKKVIFVEIFEFTLKIDEKNEKIVYYSSNPYALPPNKGSTPAEEGLRELLYDDSSITSSMNCIQPPDGYKFEKNSYWKVDDNNLENLRFNSNHKDWNRRRLIREDIPIISTQDITHSLRNKLEALENQLKTADDLLNGRINVYFPQKEKFLLDWVLDKLKEIKLNKMKSFDILPKLWEFLDTVLKCQSLLIESKCFSFQKYSFIAIFSTSMSLIVEIKNENILYSLASSIVKTLDYILSDEILSLFIQGSFTITTTILANFFYSIINLNLHNDVISTLGSRILKIWEGSIYGLESFKNVSEIVSSKVLPHICYLLGKEDTPSWVNDMFSIILGKTLFSVESLIGYLNFQIPDSKSKETTLKISDLGLFFDFLLNNLTDISHHSNVLLSLPRLFEIAQNSLNRDLLYSKRKINLNPSKITQLSDIFFLEILRLAINLCVEDDAFKYMIISNIIKMSRNNNGHYKSFNIIMEQQISEVLKKSFILIKNKNEDNTIITGWKLLHSLLEFDSELLLVYNEQLWLSLSQIDMVFEYSKICCQVIEVLVNNHKTHRSLHEFISNWIKFLKFYPICNNCILLSDEILIMVVKLTNNLSLNQIKSIINSILEDNHFEALKESVYLNSKNLFSENSYLLNVSENNVKSSFFIFYPLLSILHELIDAVIILNIWKDMVNLYESVLVKVFSNISMFFNDPGIYIIFRVHYKMMLISREYISSTNPYKGLKYIKSITEIKKIDPKVTFYMIQCQLVYLQYFDRENPEKFKIKDISLSINLILDHIIFSLENLPTNSSWEAGKMQSINSTNINLVYIYMINNQWMHLINKFSFFDKIKKIMDIFLKCSIENILEEINVSQTLTFSNLWYIYLSNAEIYELNLFGNVCLSTLMDYVFSIKFDKLLFRNDIKSYFNKQASENIIRKKNSNLDILKFKKITKYIQIIPINCIKDSIKGKLLDFLFYVDFQFTIKQYFTDMQLVENRKLLYRIMTTTNKLDSMLYDIFSLVYFCISLDNIIEKDKSLIIISTSISKEIIRKNIFSNNSHIIKLIKIIQKYQINLLDCYNIFLYQQNEYEFCIPGIIQLLLILFSEIQDTSKDIDDSLKKNITKLLKFYFKDIKKCLKILIQNYHKNTLDLKKIPNSIYLFRFFFQLSFSMSFKSYNKDLLKKLIFLISMSCFYYDNIDICLHKKSQDSLLFLLKIFCNKAENYDDILEICVTLIAVFKNMELFFMDHVKISNCDLESLSIYHFIEQRLQNLEFQDFKKISIILCYSLWEKKDINIVSNILCSILLSRAEKDSELQEEYTKLFQSIVSHLILIAKKTTDLEILYNFINLFNILLLEKSLYFSLQNLDQLFVIIVTSLSPSSKIINLSSNITIDDISKGFCKMISLILKKNYKKLYRRYHLLINCFQSLLHLFIFDTNTKMTKNNSFQRRPNWILASTSCSISAAKVYSDSLLYWIHILHLNKDIKKLKLGLSKTSEKIISKYLLWIIIEYIKLLLYYSINNEIKDILTPSIMEILKILSKYELEMINNALDNQGKTIFKKLYDNYMKYDKWNEA
ncbi:hypothetical protein PCK1_000041 [Pneumocystis canis]|nr:hypothetical protein PCK1_000041 [Pneumocystis canis]